MTELARHEVRVWEAALDLPAGLLGDLTATLSPDERERAERFVQERHRRRFAACRGIVRAILAGLTGAKAASLSFRYGAHGKPALPDQGEEGLRFNVSHSEDRALIAVARGREVGVDLERLRPVADAERIAERFFSVPERDALRALPPAARSEGFLTCWTRKEAYVKARGEGLSHPLDAFAVSVAPRSPARLWSAGADAGELARWSLAALALDDGFVGALVVDGTGWELTRSTWPSR